MKHRPLTPMTDSNLMRLLAPPTAKIGLADGLVVAQAAHLKAHLAKLQDDDIAHVVVDAVANADLEIIARAYADAPLMTGGSAAMALPISIRKRVCTRHAGITCGRIWILP